MGLYLLALMSKPMAVTLPLVFLILDYWPLGRFQKDISGPWKEKIPFFVLAFAVSLVTKIEMDQVNAVNNHLNLFFRIMHAFHSLAFYLIKLAAPIQLVPIYPFPLEIDSTYYLKAGLAALFVVLVSIGAFSFRKKFPFLAAAWGYYLVTLMPILGLVQVGSFAAGDRYTYLPGLAFFFPLAAGIARLLINRQVLFFFITAMLTLGMGYATVKQIGVWKNQESVWDRVIEAYPAEAREALMNQGIVLLKQGKPQEALKPFERASAILPARAAPYEQMGNAYLASSQASQAIGSFEEAFKINSSTKELSPDLLRNQLWYIHETLNQHEEALGEAQAALRENPENAPKPISTWGSLIT